MPKEITLEMPVADLSVNLGKQGRTKSSKIRSATPFKTVDNELRIP